MALKEFKEILMGVIRGIPVSVKTRSMFLYTGWLSYMVPMVTVSGVSAVIKGGPMVQFTKRATVQATAQAVWKTFAHDFDNADVWMASVPHSYGKDNGEAFDRAQRARERRAERRRNRRQTRRR